MTVFIAFPFRTALRIWDLFVYYGFDVLQYVAIGLLRCFESSLVKMDFEQALRFLSECALSDVQDEMWLRWVEKHYARKSEKRSLEMNELRQQYRRSPHEAPAAKPRS